MKKAKPALTCSLSLAFKSEYIYRNSSESVHSLPAFYVSGIMFRRKILESVEERSGESERRAIYGFISANKMF